MADNVTADPGTGGATFRTDDDGTAHWPYVKLAWGADNTQTIVAAAGGALPIQDGGNAITVDGTVAATQSGTWTVQPGNTANTTAWLVTGTGGTFPVTDSAGSLTVDNAGTFAVQVDAALPAGTNAIGKLAANSGVDIGDVDITSVIPGTGATNLGKAIDGASGATDTGVAVLAIRDDTLAALTPIEGDYVPLRVNSTGALHVTGGGGGEVTNAGTFVVQENGGALTALQLIDDAIFADDAAFVEGTSRLMVVGFIADETSTDTVQEHDVGVPRMTLDRKVVVTPLPHTGNGLSTMRSIDLDETEETVKATAGCVYSMWVANTATSTRFIKFYDDTVANVVVGTTVPVLTIPIPGNSSDDIAGVFTTGGMGITFATAITVAATTGVADNDTGAPGANEVIVNIFYA